MDIDKCKNLILHIGGNDAANGEDLDDFRDSYESLIDSVYVDDRRVIISELLPRDDADVQPYNEVLMSLCEDNAVEFVENFDSFLLASGEMPKSYFNDDKVHINTGGTRRLLTNIDRLHQVTRPFMAPAQRPYKTRSGFQNNRTAPPK